MERESKMRLVAFLNLFFAVVELAGGLWTNSLAILSDALHDFGDSITLFVAWALERMARKPADQKRTFGYQRLSLLSSFLTALILFGGSLFILAKAISRLFAPAQVNAGGMLLLAIPGLLLNGAAFVFLRKGQSQNEKTLSWHLLEDVFGWAIVLIGGLIIKFWNAPLVDPLMTLGFTVFILMGVWKNLQETLNIVLEGVPGHISSKDVEDALLSLPGVKGVHELHIWSLEGETDLLTAHVVVTEKHVAHLKSLRRVIDKKLGKLHIEHSTIEFEA